jgi:hypothetical protein
VGTYNSGRTIETIVAFLCLDDDKRNTLCEALRPVFARSDSVTWRELEKIPYLSACIKEGLRWDPPPPPLLCFLSSFRPLSRFANDLHRLAIGNMLRAPRVSDQELYYNQWRIPKGVSTTKL